MKNKQNEPVGANKPASAGEKSPAVTASASDEINSLLQTNFLGPALPEGAEAKARIRWAFDERLLADFYKRLSALSEQERQAVADSNGELGKKIDLYLREVARRYGARAFLSDFVMERIWELTAQGDWRSLKVLFDLMHKAHQGRSGVVPTYRSAKKSVVEELTRLKMRLDEEWPETAAAVRQLVATMIDAAPLLQFPYLRINKAELMRFLENDDRVAMAFRGCDNLSRNNLSPNQFYVRWIAFKLGRTSLEAVRQDLTKDQPLRQMRKPRLK